MGPSHHGTERPLVADGGNGLQIRKVAANILNKQSLTADNGWPSSLLVGRVSNSSSPKTFNLFRNVTQGTGVGGLL